MAEESMAPFIACFARASTGAAMAEKRWDLRHFCRSVHLTALADVDVLADQAASGAVVPALLQNAAWMARFTELLPHLQHLTWTDMPAEEPES